MIDEGNFMVILSVDKVMGWVHGSDESSIEDLKNLPCDFNYVVYMVFCLCHDCFSVMDDIVGEMTYSDDEDPDNSLARHAMESAVGSAMDSLIMIISKGLYKETGSWFDEWEGYADHWDDQEAAIISITPISLRNSRQRGNLLGGLIADL